MRTTRALFSFVALIALLLPVPDWSAADAPVQDLHFDSGGVKIHYTDQGAGEPVILVHGFTASIETNWGAPGIVDVLAKDFRVIAIDARGHGKSGKPHDPAAYGANMMEDVIRLMDHLGILKAHIAGYSMGGGITLQAVATYPDRFYSAILGGSGWQPPGSGFENMMTPLADSLEQGKGLGPLVIALNPKGQPPPTAEQIAAINERLLATNDALALAAVIRGFRGNRQITADALKALHVPMLAIVGEIDPVKASVDAMKGVATDLEVKVLPGKDHLSAVADPQLAASMHEFLLRH
jgi:pimeloyl-ACP methyl ester carboxylesterase